MTPTPRNKTNRKAHEGAYFYIPLTILLSKFETFLPVEVLLIQKFLHVLCNFAIVSNRALALAVSILLYERELYYRTNIEAFMVRHGL